MVTVKVCAFSMAWIALHYVIYDIGVVFLSIVLFAIPFLIFERDSDIYLLLTTVPNFHVDVETISLSSLRTGNIQPQQFDPE